MYSSKILVPSLFLILLGSLDCFTTVIGTVYFGTYELNPIIAGLVSSNIPGFIIIKLTVTFGIAFILVWAERTLSKLGDQSSVRIARRMLQVATLGVVFFLVIVVVNNFMVLIQVIR